MILQTQIPLQPVENKINYQSNIVLLGSCFAESIGNLFAYYKFKTQQNPFGILFHSKAIENFISDALKEKKYTEQDVFFYNEQWHCFKAHSKLNQATKEHLLAELNGQIKLSNAALQTASHVIITLGTAWVYSTLASNSIVANCHKLPQSEFKKELLSIPEIVSNLQHCIIQIKTHNPKATIIFTISPVRHIKDGFIENSRSKAHIIAAVHQVINAPNVCYFPAYEIVMDELRDYRFYNDDMLHPNAVAIQYIWEKFCSIWVSYETEKIMQQVNSIQKGLQHKAFDQHSEAHKLFLNRLQNQIKDLQKQVPSLTF